MCWGVCPNTTARLRTGKGKTMAAKIDAEKCTGCESCVDVCPVEAIAMADGKAVVSDECIDCGQCVDECPVEAIEME
ncbi:MAG: 4Fe-4S binding protein [Lentisphaerae bacterium]|nr:4Fe-4S binding protein [Lentisphaerota bacterium]MBT4815328.1 4Fe-4S binding protein [Lentisphaerota bacterium]MBT5609584.1 4Fe-4S binding protein [Lentisphaerota bacterium]MBT7057780.1 4Fe-4S binding protein [Lentisphaerota bacterium]MBT7843199.1 4Fe-4S binding protein [Lentisphaerota bacterium]